MTLDFDSLEPSHPKGTPPTALPDLALEYCSAYSIHQTALACATSWKQAQDSHGLKRHPCWRCQTGAANAKLNDIKTKSTVRIPDPWFGTLRCVRCDKVADRLITGTICRACHARASEIRKGRNSKGTTPRARLYPGVMIYEGQGENGKIMRAVTLKEVLGHQEMQRIARKAVAKAQTLLSYMIDPESGRPFGTTKEGERIWLDDPELELSLIRFDDPDNPTRAWIERINHKAFLSMTPEKPKPPIGEQRKPPTVIRRQPAEMTAAA